jgi:acetyl esterase/lipase
MVQQRKLIENISGWLRVYEDGTIDRTFTGPPEAKFITEKIPPHDDVIDGVSTHDRVIDPKSGFRVRIYVPEKIQGDPDRLPIVIHYHGGGFCISESDWFMYYSTYNRVSREARVIVVSPYLRRAPEHRLPAPCDDGYATFIWLRSLAQGKASDPWLSAHGDFTRVFLIGDSSGGNIVHQVAARIGEEDHSPLRLVGAIPIHPGFCRPERSRSEMEKLQTPFLTLDMLDNFLKLALPEGSDKSHPITCPMGSKAPAINGLKLPPYLLCIAEEDLAVDTQMEFYEAMKKANKDVELFVNAGMGHSFYMNKIAVNVDPTTSAEFGKLVSKIAEFINNH